MRIFNGLKYTLTNQAKIFCITLFSLLVALTILFSITSSSIKGVTVADVFTALMPVVTMLTAGSIALMGLGYGAIYFRTLTQTSFTRLEIFLTQIITDAVVSLIGVFLYYVSTLLFYSYLSSTYRLSYTLTYYTPDTFFRFLPEMFLGIYCARVTFTIIGYIMNKFSNRYAAAIIFFVIYVFGGIIGRMGAQIPALTNLIKFITQNGLLFAILYAIIITAIDYIVVKTHNSKPLIK